MTFIISSIFLDLCANNYFIIYVNWLNFVQSVSNYIFNIVHNLVFKKLHNIFLLSDYWSLPKCSGLTCNVL